MQTVSPLAVEFLATQPWASEPWELIDGEVVPLPLAGRQQADLIWRFIALFAPFIDGKGPEWRAVASNAGFIVSRSPDDLRSPSLAVYQLRPLDEGMWFRFSPEIAMEFVAPNQSRASVLLKKSKYFAGGTQQVWIVDPARETIAVYHPDGTRQVYHDEALLGAGLLEGFTMHVGELFASSPYREKQG